MEEQIKLTIQRRLGYILGLLEVTGNEVLKRETKKHIWDLSDEIIELVNKEQDNNDTRNIK